MDETDAETVGLSGARVSLRAEHAQRLSTRARLRVDLGLFSDPLQVRDLAADRLGRDASTRRSAVLLSARGDEDEADLEAAYYLALAPDSSLGLAAQRALVDRYGPFADLPVFHRWPSASATLLPVPLAGPLRLSGRIDVARFAPLSGYTSESGRDGLGPGDRGWIPGDGPAAPPVPCELDGAWNCGERLAVTRADARAELAFPLLVDGSQFSFHQSQGGIRGERELDVDTMKAIVGNFRAEREQHFNFLKAETNKFLLADSSFISVYPNRIITGNDRVVLARVLDKIRTAKNNITSKSRSVEFTDREIEKYEVEIYKKYSIPAACIIFILIGAPLGVMVRKGGFGVAASISLFFFLIYWAFLIGGEKLAERGFFSPWARSSNMVPR